MFVLVKAEYQDVYPKAVPYKNVATNQQVYSLSSHPLHQMAMRASGLACWEKE